MRLEIKDILNKHKNQKCLLIALGPSLNTYYDKLLRLKEEGYVIFSCGEWTYFHDFCPPDYWVLANNVQTTVTSLERINKYKATWLYSDTVDLTDYSFLEKNLKVDWLPFGHAKSGIWTPYDHPRHIINKDRLTIQEELQKYTNYEKQYSTASTVALHMVAFAILMGFANINLIGMDFDYGLGYAKNSDNIKPIELNHFDMYKNDILRDMLIIANSAKNLNSNIKIYNLNKNSYWKIFEYREI